MSGPTTDRMDVDANDGATPAPTHAAAASDARPRVARRRLGRVCQLVADRALEPAVGGGPRRHAVDVVGDRDAAAVVVGAAMAIPTAALARMGALATRGRDVNLSDGLDMVRERLGPILAAGLVWLVAGVVFLTNVASGLAIGGPVGWGLATLATWGLAATGAMGLAFWPLLADPERQGRSARDLARLAGLLVLAHPRQLGGLVLVVAALLVVSTVLFAVLITVAIGFTIGTACRAVLPAADRLEVRLADRAASAAAATAPIPTRIGP